VEQLLEILRIVFLLVIKRLRIDDCLSRIYRRHIQFLRCPC
jgi:hypothetical protein